MNKASNRAKRLAGMFGGVNPDELAKQADLEKSEKLTSRPMTTAPTKALQASFASIEAENLRLKEQLEKSQIVEFDPGTIRASIIQDRLEWSDEDADFKSLVYSIENEGQKLPILVRPHPKEAGCYQLAYGARRNRACQILGREVRAYVQDLSDEELVVAQGLENNERKNLSFIEQAIYAVALFDAGYNRKLIAKAIGLSEETNVSKLTAIANLIPQDIVRQIGAASKIGRTRWEAFARLMEAGKEKPSIIDAIRSLPQSSVWIAADSNKRFEIAVRSAEKASQHRVPKTKSSKKSLKIDGRLLVQIEQSNSVVKVTVNAKKEPAFAEFLAGRMEALMTEFQEIERRGDQ